MARIRTIKPCFFRHEELIELETSHCDYKVMLVFAALWGNCDKNGVFEWKPRYLQLDILPFYWEATGKQLVHTLMLLRENGFIKTLTDGKKVYGFIPSFQEHQRLGGKEAKDPSVHPNPEKMDSYSFGNERGSDGEALGKQRGTQEGKGREGNGVGEGNEKKSSTPTKTEIALLESFGEKEEDLKRIFPRLDYEVEKETCLAHYRLQPVPIDPYVIIVKWFKRALEKPLIITPPEYMQTEADLRAKGLL